MFVGCLCDDVCVMMWVGCCLWDVCGFFRHDRRTAPTFGTHVRIDTLKTNKIDPPHPGGFRGLSIV